MADHTPADTHNATPYDWALSWARRGVPVFPVSQGKAPATKNGFYDATTDLKQIEAWQLVLHPESWNAAAGHGVVWLDVDTDPARRKAAKKDPPQYGEVSMDEVRSGAPIGVDPINDSGHYAFAAPDEWCHTPPMVEGSEKPRYDVSGVECTIGAGLAGSSCVDWRHWGGYVRLKGPAPDGALPSLPERLRRQLTRAKGLSARLKRHERAATKIRSVEDAVAHIEATAKDGRHPALGRAVMPLVRFRLAGDSFDPAHATVAAVTAVYERVVGGERDARAEVVRDFRSVFEEVGSDFKEPVKRSKPKKQGFDAVVESLSGATLSGALAKHGIAIRYNLRWMLDEVRFGDGSWEPVTDRNQDHCRVLVGATSWEKDAWTVLWNNTLHNASTDPLKDWIEALPEWDRKGRVNHWAERAFQLRQSNENLMLARWASIHLFLGAVKRTLHPGTHADTTPVLSGAQEVGKSKHLEATLPPEHRDAFGDELNLSSRPKDMLEAIQGKMVVEIAEMSGLGKAKLDTLKAFLTRNVDSGIRLAYRRNPEVAPRRCVFFGTVNDDGTGVLPDDATGNRRWAVVSVLGQGVHWDELMADGEREQHWAEALHRVRAGETAAFPSKLRTVRAEVNEMHRAADPMEDVVAEHESEVRQILAGQPEQVGLPITELFATFGLRGQPTRNKDGDLDGEYRKTEAEVTRAESMRLGRAMRARGWGKHRVRVYGAPMWVWAPPPKA